MFWRKWRTCMEFQSCDRCKDAPIISSRDPLGMTGRICWKSPPKMTVRPPKGDSTARMSRNVRSKVSCVCRCCINASSQITAVASRSKSARLDSLGIEQYDVSCKPSIGSLNSEWAVRPPGRRRAAIPDEAAQRTICERLRNR
ncbi:hypothetical protein BDN72DRAFT_824160 [Pluteus cervinus]|uniref:Uncharacterized protein n=1 Tax=Pluteus cervinus TaxID=181527 RepID=A0ACD3AIX9_9AGAR|nr:hypothetical protein BDN72DRAFT_824160 [Pluteus cervinus]